MIFNISIKKTMVTAALLIFSANAFSVEVERFSSNNLDIFEIAEDSGIIQADNDIQLRRMKKLVSNNELDSSRFLKNVEKMRIKLDSKS